MVKHDIGISYNRRYLTNKRLSPYLRNWDLYVLILPVIAYYIIFLYVPMYGVQIGFKDYIASIGIWGSPWVGLKHFARFFNSYYLGSLLWNTVSISLYSIIAGFPAPIILALIINELGSKRFKSLVQTVSYAPHFISMVVMVGMLFTFLSPRTGVINHFIKALGAEPIYFMGKPQYFKSIYVWSGVWQNTGWASIIYIAALTNIDIQQHEAAIIDGANRLRRIWHINLPGIMPIVIMILIISIGNIMGVGFEKVFLMQNSMNMETSDVISTFVYRVGILDADYSFSTAVGLFNSIINFILLAIANYTARHFGKISLW